MSRTVVEAYEKLVSASNEVNLVGIRPGQYEVPEGTVFEIQNVPFPVPDPFASIIRSIISSHAPSFGPPQSGPQIDRPRPRPLSESTSQNKVLKDSTITKFLSGGASNALATNTSSKSALSGLLETNSKIYVLTAILGSPYILVHRGTEFKIKGRSFKLDNDTSLSRIYNQGLLQFNVTRRDRFILVADGNGGDPNHDIEDKLSVFLTCYFKRDQDVLSPKLISKSLQQAFQSLNVKMQAVYITYMSGAIIEHGSSESVNVPGDKRTNRVVSFKSISTKVDTEATQRDVYRALRGYFNKLHGNKYIYYLQQPNC